MTARTRTVLTLIETGGPGGAETVCAQLLEGATAHGWRGVAVVPHRGWLYERLTNAGVETHVVAERHPFDVAWLARVARLAHRARADVVHGHLFGASVRAALVGRLTGRPAVGTLHGGTDIPPGERFRAAKFAILRAGLSRLACVSAPLADDVRARTGFPARRLVVIPNGVDMARFGAGAPGDARASLGVATGDFVVGAVGNLNRAKAYDVLLRAAALLRPRIPRLRVVIVGDHRGRASAELFALRDQLGVGDLVEFAGFRPDVAQLLGAFDAYALTSRSEGFSIALVEAMASALPVVATRCGGPERIVDDGESGLLVPTDSPAAVAAAIARLHADRALAQRLGAVARERVSARFALDAQVRAYVSLYESCLTSGRGAATPAAVQAAGAAQ